MAQSSDEHSEDDLVDDIHPDSRGREANFPAGRAIRKMQKLAQKIYETTPGISDGKRYSSY